MTEKLHPKIIMLYLFESMILKVTKQKIKNTEQPVRIDILFRNKIPTPNPALFSEEQVKMQNT